MKSFFRHRFLINPLVRNKAESIGNSLLVNKIKREVPIIVSLTEKDTDYMDLELSIFSIFNQSIRPDRVILWLSDEYKNLSELPYEITQFIKNGLEIRFVKDLRGYNKFIYALKEYPNAINITASEDVYYKENWLEKLYLSYLANSNDIQVHLAHRVVFDKDRIFPSSKWEKYTNNETAGYNYFINSDGGILIPPKSLSAEIFREDVFMKYLPFNEDLWLWIICLLSSRKIRIVKDHIGTITCTNIIKKLDKRKDEFDMRVQDRQITKMIRFYGQNIFTKLTQSQF